MAKPKKASRGISARGVRSKPARPADRLLDEIRALVETAREQTARAVNSALVGLYWQIGKRIREDVLQSQRAEYGEEIVSTLSKELTAEYGRGFSRSNLFTMIQFADAFPDFEIVQTLSGQLSWSHFRAILPLEDSLKRSFYAEMCRVERWSVRTLRKKIDHLLYERTAISKKPEKLIEHDIAALRDEDRMSAEHVELLQLDKSGIRVAQYLSELPPQKLLEKKLHDSIRLARERLARETDAAALADPLPDGQTRKPKPRAARNRKSQ